MKIISCKVKDCVNKIHGNGYCSKHYMRLRLHGTIDIPNPGQSRPGKMNGMFGTHRSGKLNPFFGKHHSSSVIERNRLAHLGRKLSREHRMKIKESCKGINAGPSSGLWKGDSVGYVGLHKWVERHRGAYHKCSNCQRAVKCEWANKSGVYKRDLTDWLRLCKSCHRVYDSFRKQDLIKV